MVCPKFSTNRILKRNFGIEIRCRFVYQCCFVVVFPKLQSPNYSKMSYLDKQIWRVEPIFKIFKIIRILLIKNVFPLESIAWTIENNFAESKKYLSFFCCFFFIKNQIWKRCNGIIEGNKTTYFWSVMFNLSPVAKKSGVVFTERKVRHDY